MPGSNNLPDVHWTTNLRIEEEVNALTLNDRVNALEAGFGTPDPIFGPLRSRGYSDFDIVEAIEGVIRLRRGY